MQRFFIITVISALFILLFNPACNKQKGQRAQTENSDISINTVKKNGFATISNRKHPGNTIGYRFFEHTPLVFEKQKTETEKDPGLHFQLLNDLENSFSVRPGLAVYKRDIPSDSNWIQQTWTFYLAPVADGVDLLLIVQTYKKALPYYYGVQQCFRMSGATNQAWRQEIARTPAFSEFDLWSAEGKKFPKTSLTRIRRNGLWQELPADSVTVGARTPFGILIDHEKYGNQLPLYIGPYQARMDAPIDNGLITRINKAGSWVCGIYWENTSHVSDHHPADCLHCIVNIGNTPAGSKRAVRGKIYWFQGSLQDLSEKFSRDFLH
jgi:hypothetical protein